MKHTCPYCKGEGSVNRKPKYYSRICPHCAGGRNDCKHCNGKGWQELLLENYI